MPPQPFTSPPAPCRNALPPQLPRQSLQPPEACPVCGCCNFFDDVRRGFFGVRWVLRRFQCGGGHMTKRGRTWRASLCKCGKVDLVHDDNNAT